VPADDRPSLLPWRSNRHVEPQARKPPALLRSNAYPAIKTPRRFWAILSLFGSGTDSPLFTVKRRYWDKMGRAEPAGCQVAPSTSSPCAEPSNQANKMTERPSKKPRGRGRVAFIARLDVIRSEIANGEFLVAIHAKHQAALGITYSAFRKLVQRYAEDAKPIKQTLRTTPPPAPRSAAGPSPAPAIAPKPARSFESQPTQTEPVNVRHEPTGRPTFRHHGIVQEGEPEQLFGPGYLPRRGS
jgi:hypothetical protein